MKTTPPSPTDSASSSTISPAPTSSTAVFEILRDYFDDGAQALRFMRRFSGIVLKMPAMPAVERLARDAQIVSTLTGNPRTATVRRLAGIHGVAMRSVAKTFAKNTGEGLKNFRRKQEP